MQNLFQRYLSAIDYRITDGSEFLWNCWKNARYYDCTTNYGHASMTANPDRGIVYEITVYATLDSDHPYRWTNPDFVDIRDAEAHERRLDSKKAWEDINWIDTESEDDILDKVKAILNNIDFDKRVVINIWLEETVITKLALLAHEADITLNEYFCAILRAECAKALDGTQEIQ